MNSDAVNIAMKEARSATKLSLETDGMLLRFDPNNIQTAYMCLVGPETTPYEHCFFLFKFTLANDHPLSPPSVVYLTNDGSSRFNPNLYTNGFVCLSILGTWQGPSWEPSTLECVGQTIRSMVLTATPLRCEPGYSSYDVAQLAPYSKFVEFHSLDFSLTQAIESPPEGFEEFKQPLIEYFIGHMAFYTSKLEWLRLKGDGQTINESYSQSTLVTEYGKTAIKLTELYQKLSGKDWIASGDGGFDPTKRIWYDECDPSLMAGAAPTDQSAGDEEEWASE
jgi:ubiquitin-protein ligase